MFNAFSIYQSDSTPSVRFAEREIPNNSPVSVIQTFTRRFA